MKPLQTFRSARAHSAALSFAVLIAGGCGQQEGENFSSNLQVPQKPGDGYGLVRTIDDRHVIGHISVGGNFVFFEIPWQGLYQMPKYGGNVTAVDRDTKAEFFGVVASGSELLWLKSHFDSNDYADELLLRRPTEGGPTAVLRHGALDTVRINTLNGLSADANHVYMLTESSIDVTPIAGGKTEQVSVSVFPPGPGPGFAGDYPIVYFTTCEADPSTCVLKRADLSAGTSQVVASLPADAQIIGLDADAVYLLDSSRLWSIARADGSERELLGAASGVHPRLPAVLDGQSLYFMGTDPGAQTLPAMRLMTIPKAGGALAILGSDSRINQYIPWDLVVDDEFAFVLTSPTLSDSGNEILAFPKTPLPAP